MTIRYPEGMDPEVRSDQMSGYGPRPRRRKTTDTNRYRSRMGGGSSRGLSRGGGRGGFGGGNSLAALLAQLRGGYGRGNDRMNAGISPFPPFNPAGPLSAASEGRFFGSNPSVSAQTGGGFSILDILENRNNVPGMGGNYYSDIFRPGGKTPPRG